MIFNVKKFHTLILPEIWITVERLVEEKVTRQKFFFAGIKTYDPLSGMGLLGNVINRVLGSCLIQEYFSVQQHRQFFNLAHATTKVFWRRVLPGSQVCDRIFENHFSNSFLRLSGKMVIIFSLIFNTRLSFSQGKPRNAWYHCFSADPKTT